MKHIARKRFGQHFLVDAAIIESIVSAIDPQPHEALVEIGPGLGALTLPLLARGARMTVIELDRDLAERLRQRGDVEVVQDDVLRVNFAQLGPAAQAPLRIVGNLPYNISSPILFHLLPFAHQVQDQHFMLQSEVVYRMVAQPGHKAYGRLSVMLQWRYDMEVVVDVPPEAFDPPPAVNSAVIRMVPLAQPPALEAQPRRLRGPGVDREDARHAAFSFDQAWSARHARKAIQSRAVTSASYRRVPPSVTWTIPNRVITGTG